MTRSLWKLEACQSATLAVIASGAFAIRCEAALKFELCSVISRMTHQ